MTEQLQAAAEAIRKGERLLFVTGAGISADSGLPTYRGVGGLYEDDGTDDGMPIEEALSGAMFQLDPAVCWKHIARIEAACRGARPNAAHHLLAELEAWKPGVVVLTQNVDGLHRSAGSKRVIEIHGTIHHLRCPACYWRLAVPDYAGLKIPPICPQCGAIVRPEVVLFGERLPLVALQQLESELRQGFDAVFFVGTSALFEYIAEPVRLARRWGAATFEINPGDTWISAQVDHRIPLGAAAAAHALREALRLP